MSTPVFSVGDEVECEASVTCDSTPRWNYLHDVGGCGKWLVGKVTTSNANRLVVKFSGKDWSWPSTQDKDYRPDQWKRPGYLRHKQAVQPMANPCQGIPFYSVTLKMAPWTDKPEPEIKQQRPNPTRAQWLGRENTQACECGAWVSGGLHSSWCKCH
jgi:hypothetical protein